MNTSTPRIRAGAPAPIQTRRVEPSMLGTPAPLGLMKYEATEFAGPEPAEQDVETVEQYDNDAMEITWMGYLLMYGALGWVFFGLGYLAGRYVS